MRGAQIVWLVIGILVLEALIWIPLLVWLRRRSARLAESIKESIAQSGERSVMEPQSALYRGGTGRFGFVKSNAVIALTDRRIIFQGVLGKMVEIPLADVAEVSENKWFLRSYRSGRMHLILHLRDGSLAGFIVDNHDAWMNALQSFVPRS